MCSTNYYYYEQGIYCSILIKCNPCIPPHDCVTLRPGSPTACRNIRINLLGDRRMDVVWRKPFSTGRDDFYYVLEWSTSLSPSLLTSLGLSGREINGSVTIFDQSDAVSQSITGLRPETPYSVSVTARNGVSDQDDPGSKESSTCQLQGVTLEGNIKFSDNNESLHNIN